MKKGLGKILVMAAGLFGGSAAVCAEGMLPTATAKTSKKSDKSTISASMPTIVHERSKRNPVSGSASYRHNKPGYLDQKSKRQKLRSNASFGRSKKCTTKR